MAELLLVLYVRLEEFGRRAAFHVLLLHGGSFQRHMGLGLQWWFYCKLGVMEVRKCKGSVARNRRCGVVQVAVDLQLHASWLLEMCGRLLWQGAVLGVQSGGGGVMLF